MEGEGGEEGEGEGEGDKFDTKFKKYGRKMIRKVWSVCLYVESNE